MMLKGMKRLLALVFCIIILATTFTGCGNNNQTPKAGDTTKQETKQETKPEPPKDKQYLIYNMGQEPDTIDPGLESAMNAANVCNQIFEGLMGLDKDNNPVPACAESVDYDPKNPVKFIFHLKKGLKWSDGKPLTASDFEYAWKRVLDPATAADYVQYLYYIKNGEAYNTKKANVEDVGVKAKDDLTLEVELEYPTSYFLQLCSFPTLMPVRKDMIEKDPEKWTQSPATYIGNGPFKMKEWVHDSYIEFVKNENYRDAANVKLEGMRFVMVASSTQALTAWEAGEIDYIDDIPTPEIPRLLKDGKMVVAPYIGTYYIAVNCQKPVLSDPRVRKALALAIDRPALIETVWKDGRKPATGWVPYGISDADPSKQFRDVGGNYYDPKGDVAEAKRLLAEAGYPDGKGFPEFEYAYNKNDTHIMIAQAVQDMWKKNLGISVRLNEVDWKVFLPQRKKGNYEISRDGWIGDYMDPATFTDILRSGDGNNDAQYKNSKYDQLLLDAKKEPDPQKRMQILHQAEDILIKDEMGLIPVAFYVRDICKKPYIKDVYQVPTGVIYFRGGYIEGKNK